MVQKAGKFHWVQVSGMVNWRKGYKPAKIRKSCIAGLGTWGIGGEA